MSICQRRGSPRISDVHLPSQMAIYFAEVENNTLTIKGAAQNREHAEGVSKAILWFLKVFPNYAVDRMMVPPPDSPEMPSSIPYDQFRDWDYRLPVRVLVISLRQYTSIKETFVNSS